MRLLPPDFEWNYWFTLAVFFGAVTVVAALGEWVFHWWADPGQYVAAGSLLLTLLSLGFGASKRDLRQMGRRFDRLERNQERVAQGQERLATAEAQAEQTRLLRDIAASLREVVGSFRPPP